MDKNVSDSNQELSEKEIKTAEKEIKKLIDVLGIEGSLSASYASGTLDVVLETEDSGIVIGYHGEVLESLQLVMAFCISKKIGRFVRVSLEVGDYKKNRTGYLENLANQAREEALSSGKEVALSDLKSWERRIVHVYLQEDKDVVSESVGEGRERTLIVKPRV